MEGALGQGKKLRFRQKSAQPQVPAVPASWTAGDLKKRSSGDTQVVPAMDMPFASCTGGDLTQPPSGDAQVVEAMGMQLGALAQATELLADAAFASSATPAATSDSDLLANAQVLMHEHLEEVHRDVLAVHAQRTGQRTATSDSDLLANVHEHLEEMHRSVLDVHQYMKRKDVENESAAAVEEEKKAERSTVEAWPWQL